MRKIAIIILAAVLGAACSEEALTPQVDFSEGIVLPRETELDKRIYDFHEKYGTYIIYKDITNLDINYGWGTSYTKHGFAAQPDDPVKVNAIIDFLEDNMLRYYTDDVLKKGLPVKLFLVTNLLYNNNKKYVYYALPVKSGFAIDITKATTDAAIRRARFELNWALGEIIFKNLPVEPTEFLAVTVFKDILINMEDETDPDYFHYLLGYIESARKSTASSLKYRPEEYEDFGQYLGFIASTTQDEADALCEKWPKLNSKYNLIIEYFQVNFGIDLKKMHYKYGE